MASNKSVLDIVKNKECIDMKAELEESLKQRATTRGRIKSKIDKIKEKIKPTRWVFQKPKSWKQKKRRNARTSPESDPALNENLQIFQSGMNFVEMFAKPIGFNISYEWKTNPRFWFLIFILTFSWFQFFYTQYLSVTNGQPTKVLEVFAIYGIGTSIVSKTVCFFKYYKEMKASLNFTFKLCRENVTGRRAENLKSHLLISFTICKLATFLGVSALFVYAAYPIKAFIIDREFVSLLPIEIIFVDQSTQSGFFIGNVCMSIMGIYACCVVLYVGLIFICSICNYSIQVGIINEDFKDLEDMWSGKSETTVEYRRAFLRNICEKYQDMNEYINVIKKIFDTNIFISFCASYLSQIICLFEIRVNNWIPGYGIAFALFDDIIFHCFLGTQLTVYHERLHSILTQSNWYTYDLHSQRMYQLLLHFSMNGSELWIGPLAPLNVYTASEIVKSIYTYYTILMKVI